MQQKSSTDAPPRRMCLPVPAMLNRRRISLKRILNRYMGLSFTQHQPRICSADVCEAGLGEAFKNCIKEMVPHWRMKNEVAEPADIEVNHTVIALDEEVSFSYYRYLSLRSPIYIMPLVPDLTRYQDYCQQYQEGLDQHSAVARALRKKALNDYMQDMLPVVYHFPIIRLSVYDQFTDGQEQKALGDILTENNERFYPSIAEYLGRQMERIEKLF